MKKKQRKKQNDKDDETRRRNATKRHRHAREAATVIRPPQMGRRMKCLNRLLRGCLTCSYIIPLIIAILLLFVSSSDFLNRQNLTLYNFSVMQKQFAIRTAILPSRSVSNANIRSSGLHLCPEISLTEDENTAIVGARQLIYPQSNDYVAYARDNETGEAVNITAAEFHCSNGNQAVPMALSENRLSFSCAGQCKCKLELSQDLLLEFRRYDLSECVGIGLDGLRRFVSVKRYGYIVATEEQPALGMQFFPAFTAQTGALGRRVLMWLVFALYCGAMAYLVVSLFVLERVKQAKIYLHAPWAKQAVPDNAALPFAF